MKINPAYFAFNLVETYVIEALKACTSYRSHPVVRYEEVLFPTHEDIFPLCDVVDCDRASFRLASQRPKCAELSPVAEIDLLVGSPVLMLSKETIF